MRADRTELVTSMCLVLAVLSLAGSCEPGATNGNGTPPTTPPPPIPAGPVGQPGMRHRLAIGQNHACAIAKAGSVWCWGENGSWELGDGTTNRATTPTRVTGLEGAVEVAAGDTHTCALRGDGTVACWGYNLYGQSGDGTLPAEGTPEAYRKTSAPVPGLTHVASLAGAMHTFCARAEDGTVQCWGNGQYFLIGAGATQKLARPTRVQGLRGVLDMSSSTQACARVAPAPSETWCWGMNHSERPRPRPGTARAKQVAVGLGHICIVDSTGGVSCWGENGSGELGLPGVGEVGATEPLRRVAGLTDVRQVATGRNVTCALRGDGKVSCWGATWGLGHVPPNLRDTHNVGHGGSAAQWQYVDAPVEVPGVEGIEEIAGGFFAMCGLRGDDVVCWDEAVRAPMHLAPAPAADGGP